MFLKENISLAVSGLKSNKMRAFLTMLGIIIGIGSVIAIVSIGKAYKNYVNEMMTSFGASNIYLYVTPRDSSSDNSIQTVDTSKKIDDSNLLSLDQINRIEEKYSNEISSISLSDSAEWGTGKAEDGRLSADVTVTGANAGFADVNNLKMLRGRFLRDRDVSAARQVAVISDRSVSNLFPGHEDPLGKVVDVSTDSGQDQSFTVVGVYKYERSGMMMGGGASGKNIRTDLYIPISVEKQTADNQNFVDAVLKLKGVQNSQAFTQKLKTYMQHFYANNPKYTCDVYNAEKNINEANSMLDTLSIAIAAIAAIALLVGGIGVMNIMLVSVTERTREIGTRKALGARSSYIRTQFIVESIIICVIGGLIGIVVGILLAAAGVSLLNAAQSAGSGSSSMKLAISIPTVFISVGFSMLIGIFFGYYPAKKASRLDPIEALRYE